MDAARWGVRGVPPRPLRERPRRGPSCCWCCSPFRGVSRGPHRVVPGGGRGLPGTRPAPGSGPNLPAPIRSTVCSLAPVASGVRSEALWPHSWGRQNLVYRASGLCGKWWLCTSWPLDPLSPFSGSVRVPRLAPSSGPVPGLGLLSGGCRVYRGKWPGVGAGPRPCSSGSCAGGLAPGLLPRPVGVGSRGALCGPRIPPHSVAGGGGGVGGFHPVRVSRDRCDLRIHMSHAEESLVRRCPRDYLGCLGPDRYVSTSPGSFRCCMPPVSFGGACGPGVSVGEGSSGTRSALRPIPFPCDQAHPGCPDSCRWLPLVSVAEARFPSVLPPPPSVELLPTWRVMIARSLSGSPVPRRWPAPPVLGPSANQRAVSVPCAGGLGVPSSVVGRDVGSLGVVMRSLWSLSVV